MKLQFHVGRANVTHLLGILKTECNTLMTDRKEMGRIIQILDNELFGLIDTH
jgi:hypothetical protein